MPADTPQTISGCRECSWNPAGESGLCKTCEGRAGGGDMVMAPREPTTVVGDETWESIAAWQRETFGPVELARQAQRAAEEMDELLADPSDVEEAADVCIVLAGYPGIRDAINRKMAKNRSRQWRLNGDGTGYHVKATAPSTTSTAEQVGTSEASAQRIIDGLQDAVAGNFTVRSYSMPRAPSPGEGDAPVAWPDNDPRYEVDVTYEVWCGDNLEASADDLSEARRYEAQYQPCSLLIATTYRQPVDAPRARPTPATPEGLREKVADQGCTIPPKGWWCSREPGHEGPCAARRTEATR